MSDAQQPAPIKSPARWRWVQIGEHIVRVPDTGPHVLGEDLGWALRERGINT